MMIYLGAVYHEPCFSFYSKVIDNIKSNRFIFLCFKPCNNSIEQSVWIRGLFLNAIPHSSQAKFLSFEWAFFLNQRKSAYWFLALLIQLGQSSSRGGNMFWLLSSIRRFSAIILIWRRQSAILLIPALTTGNGVISRRNLFAWYE